MEVPDRTGSEENGVDDRSLLVEIVEEVADARDADPMTMPPLSDVFDLDALARLFPGDTHGTDPRGTLAFTYAECAVAVHADGDVDVRPIRESPAGPTEDGR